MPESQISPTFPQLVRSPVIARLTGLHEVTIRKLAAEQKIPSFKIGGARLFDPSAVLAAVAQGPEARA